MQLSPAQQDQLLLNRKAHLQQMRSIYQERHNLNMQVRGVGAVAARLCGQVRSAAPVVQLLTRA